MKRNYTKEFELEEYARMMFTKHNLPKDWKFLVLDKQQRKNVGGNGGLSAIGYCSIPMKKIFMPIEIVAEFKMHTLQDIFLHELAHAINGKENYGHNKKFREICKQLNCHSFKADHNPYIFDMYNTYDITPQQNLICTRNYYKNHKQ